MTITDLDPKNQEHITQVAALLTDAFRHIPDTWSTQEEALAEVQESFAPGRISRVALDEVGDVLGWIGGIPEYDGNVYELHPLAVKTDQQRKGIGTALIQDFEEQVRQRGAMTIMLGTDDEFEGTNLFGVDLYPDIAARIYGIENRKNHPYEFYLKCGYVIYGLLPDANGFGKPDILMAKRVGPVKGSNDAQE